MKKLISYLWSYRQHRGFCSFDSAVLNRKKFNCSKELHDNKNYNKLIKIAEEFNVKKLGINKRIKKYN